MGNRGQSNRSIYAVVIALAILALPPGAHGLGLGEARVESYLNQPLDVRMRLLDASEDDLDALTVAPAGPEDFERLGMMSGALALDLEIVVDRSQSPPVIRVTSNRPVTDPVVQLLIDARWSSGRMLREYTLFLDPPSVEVQAPAPAPVDDSRDAPEPAPRQREPEPPEARQPAPRTSDSAGDRPVATARDGRYGPVASGETLWSIAQANLPAADVTMDQMMIAIVELNPRAFRDGNINRLLRGAELEMPSAARARALDRAQAAAAVAAQNRAFRRRAGAETPTVSDAGRDLAETGGDAAPATGTAADGESDTPDHRLSLVPPGDEDGSAGSGDDAAEVESLRQRLARAEEELYAARQEAEEFQSRVEELESLVRENPGGLGIRDAELAGLEQTLRAAREATREGADPAMRAEVSERLSDYLEQYTAGPEDATETGAPDSTEPRPDPEFAETAPQADDGQVADAGGEADEPAAESASADAERPQADDEAAQPARSVTEVGDADRGLLSNPLVLLAAGLAVLILIAAGLGLALKRKRAETIERERPLKRASDMPRPPPAAKSPVDEARERVDANPADLAAHLALLETLASEGQEREFGDALESMFEHVESGEETEWREALDLAGRIVPGHALVKGSADWVAEPPGPDADAPVSELDEESEVDDLMSRLDAESDEGEGDADWVVDDEPGDGDSSSEDAAPLLREREPEAPAGREHDADESEADVDFGALTEEASGPGEVDSAADRDEPEPDAGPADRDESDDLILDWPDFDDESAADSSESRTTGDGEEAASGDEGDDDIFSQSDDDIDVKMDLARAYLSWNSSDSARTLLEEVVREGNESQRAEAQKLLDELSAGDTDS